MRKVLIGLPVALVALALFAGAALADRPNQSWHFVAPLSGAEEAPVPRDTLARGVAIFHLSADGETMSFKLIAANIENVVQAHVHCCGGFVGTNTGIAIWLYPNTTGGPALTTADGRHDGVLASGTFTSNDFVGQLEGLTMAQFVQKILNGEAYVNVHTNDQVAPPNTGPGDFPGGEIRGQLD